MKNKKILIYFILSIVFFFYGYYILKMFNISIFPLFIYLFINFFIGIILTVVIHELGHVFAGLMNGYKFYSFQFLFVSVIRYKTKIKIELQGFEKFVLGMTVMFPAGEIEDVKILNYIKGGYRANYIFATISLILFPFINNLFLSVLIYISALFNIILGYSNSQPFESKVLNDGYYIREIEKGGNMKNILIDNFVSVASLLEGKELSAIISELKGDYEYTKPFFKCYYHYLKYRYNSLCENEEELFNDMKEIIESADELLEMQKEEYLYELLYHFSYWVGDFESADKIYEYLEKGLENSTETNALRAKAYYEYYILKDIEKTLKSCEKLKKHKDESLFKTLSDIDLILINKLLKVVQ